MTNELTLERHKGLRVGYLVQLAEDNTTTSREGILREISRPTPRSRFTYVVEWQDNGEVQVFSLQKIVRSQYSDYPHWDSAAAKSQQWLPGSSHYWTLFYTNGEKDMGSCLFCGRMRGLMAENNAGVCRGPSQISFR